MTAQSLHKIGTDEQRAGSGMPFQVAEPSWLVEHGLVKGIKIDRGARRDGLLQLTMHASLVQHAKIHRDSTMLRSRRPRSMVDLPAPSAASNMKLPAWPERSVIGRGRSAGPAHHASAIDTSRNPDASSGVSRSTGRTCRSTPRRQLGFSAPPPTKSRPAPFIAGFVVRRVSALRVRVRSREWPQAGPPPRLWRQPMCAQARSCSCACHYCGGGRCRRGRPP
jgi:hypothetical protein